MVPRRIATRGADASQRSQRVRSSIERLLELRPIEAEHRWAPFLSSDRRGFQPLHELTVDLDDKLPGRIALASRTEPACDRPLNTIGLIAGGPDGSPPR